VGLNEENALEHRRMLMTDAPAAAQAAGVHALSGSKVARP
jgi:hypothetical protein